MTCHRVFLLTVSLIAGLSVPTVPVCAQDATDPATVSVPGAVAYVTGGIGSDETRALEAEAKDYDLHITNADMDGHFTSNTDLIIRNKANGQTVIQAGNTGPLFFARLPSGDYVVEATNGDKSLTRMIKISATKTTDLELIWKPS